MFPKKFILVSLLAECPIRPSVSLRTSTKKEEGQLPLLRRRAWSFAKQAWRSSVAKAHIEDDGVAGLVGDPGHLAIPYGLQNAIPEAVSDPGPGLM